MAPSTRDLHARNDNGTRTKNSNANLKSRVTCWIQRHRLRIPNVEKRTPDLHRKHGEINKQFSAYALTVTLNCALFSSCTSLTVRRRRNGSERLQLPGRQPKKYKITNEDRVREEIAGVAGPSRGKKIDRILVDGKSSGFRWKTTITSGVRR